MFSKALLSAAVLMIAVSASAQKAKVESKPEQQRRNEHQQNQAAGKARKGADELNALKSSLQVAAQRAEVNVDSLISFLKGEGGIVKLDSNGQSRAQALIDAVDAAPVGEKGRVLLAQIEVLFGETTEGQKALADKTTDVNARLQGQGKTPEEIKAQIMKELMEDLNTACKV